MIQLKPTAKTSASAYRAQLSFAVFWSDELREGLKNED